MVKQRRTTTSSSLPSISEDGSTCSEQQNQRKFNLYNDTIRQKTKKTKDKLLMRLLYIPLIVVVICIISLVVFTTKFDRKKNNVPSSSSSSSSLLLTMSKSSSLKSDKNSNTMTTLKGEEEQKQQQVQQQQMQQQKEVDDQNKNNNNDLLPKWIVDYVKWHQTQRQLYPGDALFNSTNKEAPKLLVRTCLGICGGLHDRLGQLPFDIYLASKLQRVLLIAWQRPKSLENFLLPPNQKPSLPNLPEGKDQPLYIDWTIPSSQKFGFNDIRTVRSYIPELFDGYPEDHPGDENFWTIGFKKSLKRASATGTTSNKYRNAKILRHRLLGHLDEPILEKLLFEEGYYNNDDKHTPQQLHTTPTFGTIWNLFFIPSPAVEKEIILSLQEMNLLELDSADDSESVVNEESVDLVDIKNIKVKNYTAVHCRVRHPKAHPKGKTTLGINQRYPADKTGLPWMIGGVERQFALEIATSALQCAIQITNNSNVTTQQPPIYFLSDSNDLVKHVSIELYDTTSSGYLETNKNNISSIYPPLYDIVHTVSGNSVGDNQGHNNNNNYLIRSRNVTLENTHIDRQKGREPYAYYGTFIDLYITMYSKCVIYGVGYYAAFAAKLSGVQCKYVYVEESWGIQSEKNAQICPNTLL